MQPASAPRGFDANETRIVHFTGLAHAATHYVELVYPTLAVGLAAETGLAPEVVLSWSFGGYLLFGLGALPAGLAADRFGARKVIIGGLLLAGVSAVLAGWTEPGWPLALALSGIGAGASLYHPAGTGLLSRAVAARGRALGINGIYGNVGIALSPFLTFVLVESVGWRATLWLTGGVILAGTLISMRLNFVEPPPARQLGSKKSRVASLSRRALWVFVVLCSITTLAGFIYRGNVVAQPTLFSEHISFMGYGLAASLAMLMGIGGQYLGGLIADRRELRITYLVFHLLALPALLAMALLSGWPLLLVAGFYVFFALGTQPVENSLFAVLTPERWRSTAYGLKFVLSFGLGATAVFLVRGVAQTWNWSAVYLALAAFSVVTVTGILLLLLLTRGQSARNA